MNRRTCLALLAGVGTTGLAGCLSGSEGSATSQPTETDEHGTTAQSTADTASASPTSPTDTGPDVSTPAPGECDSVEPPSPSTGEGLPDPKQYPERPELIERDAVTSFIEAYEVAYRFNQRLAALAADGACVSYLDMSASELTVADIENGFTGSVTTRGSYTGTSCPAATGTDTPTPLPHVDLAFKTAEYSVTDRFVIRNGTVVECWR